MRPSVRPLVEVAFKAVEAKDLDRVLACFTDDAVLIDPHYPVIRMEGKAAIADGITWAFGGMQKMGFEIDNYFESADGQRVAVEMSTHHVLKMGNRHLDFPQVFILEFAGDLVQRMQAYEPYGPGGAARLFIGAERLRRRLRRG